MKQTRLKQPVVTAAARPAPPKHKCDMYAKKPEYAVTNADL